MKITATAIYMDWCGIVKNCPSYRLGQHYVNVLGLKYSTLDGVDLFNIESVGMADSMLYQMCERYDWCPQDLPVFGDYDLSTIKTL